MLWLNSGNLKEGRIGEYIAWVKKNKKLLQERGPKELKYRGSYISVLGFGRYDVTDIWEMKKYGDFDAFRNWNDKVWNKLNAEYVDFFMPGSGGATLLREVSDVVFVEPKKPRK